MPDTRRSAAALLTAAVARGDERATRSAAIAVLDAARAAGAPWTDEKATRFVVLPLTSIELGAIMLAGRGTTEGPRLWARHSATDDALDELRLADFVDLLLCRLVAGDTSPLPPTPVADALDRNLVSEADTLRRILTGIERKDGAGLAYTLKRMERDGRGAVFLAGIRAVARSRGVVLPT